MELHIAVMVCALMMLLFGSVSRVSEQFFLTGPMFFTLVGITLASITSVTDITPTTFSIKLLAELTLIIVLFVDASEINHKHLANGPSKVGWRLLLIGLPLTALLGAMIGIVIFEQLTWAVVVLIALMLSPTDAALGQPLIKSPLLPEQLKQNISVESGLNDGLSLPAIVICIAILSGEVTDNAQMAWLFFIGTQLILGPVVGAFVGWFGGKFVEYCAKKQWMSSVYQSLCALALPLLAYSAAEIVEGNGFIAAFVCGYFFGVQDHSIRQKVQEFGEAEGQQLTLFVFLVFGFVIVPLASPYWDMQALIYALCSLTLVRMIPVFISLTGVPLCWREKLLYAWFGPRGIASILYLLMFIAMVGLTGYEYPIAVIVLTVLISIVLHGISALPIAKWYSKLANDH